MPPPGDNLADRFGFDASSDPVILLDRLVELAVAHHVEVRRVAIEGRSGTCALRGRTMVVINDIQDPEESIEVIAGVLAEIDLPEDIAPELRAAIERYRRG